MVITMSLSLSLNRSAQSQLEKQSSTQTRGDSDGSGLILFPPLHVDRADGARTPLPSKTLLSSAAQPLSAISSMLETVEVSDALSVLHAFF